MKRWEIIRRVSAFYIFIFVIAVCADLAVFSLVEYGRKPDGFIGCYAYDAMLIGFECKGFSAQLVVEGFLNLPLWQFFAPLFAIMSWRAAALTVLMWMFPVLFMIAGRKLRTVNA
ncbi:hypothetical protein [Enterovibrio norvegicus]|uniref:hypothetical protein n=1 Tax=Enterovibrio norvegicus TaxID=188144 RepID=UPI000C81E233|nr:hypothetical protein [Enterovibrio norvegicus]PMN66213.1 hypothetical protein BCT27_24620 [Enterovibrio norvegicus]